MPPPSPSGLSITSYGGRCDGSFDNSAALAAALRDAKARGLAVAIPAGNCAYGDLIRLDSVVLRGQGDASVLSALHWQRSSIFMSGTGAQVRDLKLAGVVAPTRQANWEATRISLFAAKDFLIDNVTIEGSSAAGIQTADGTTDGVISNNRIRNTLSDSIHMTDRASYITVENNVISGSGDDGIAVVSYRDDGAVSHHITARGNSVSGNRWGRSMSVVGGFDVLYENNRMSDSGAYACLYLAQEAGYATFAISNVVAQRNSMVNCGSTTTGHSAILLYSDGDATNTGVSLVRNDIRQNGQIGIRIYGPNTAVTVDSNRVTGAVPALDITTAGITAIAYASGPVGP